MFSIFLRFIYLPSGSQYVILLPTKTKTPSGAYFTREGVQMCGAPTNVPLMGCRALIAPVSYVQWLKEAVGGLSIPHRARGVKEQGFSAGEST